MKKKENEYGVVGIEFYPPLEEIEFPAKYPEECVNEVLSIVVYDEKILFYQNSNVNSLNLPEGNIKSGESACDCVRNILKKNMGISQIDNIIPIANYSTKKLFNSGEIHYGRVFVVIVNDFSKTNLHTKMKNLKFIPLIPYIKDHKQYIPRLPLEISRFELYSIVIYAFQRMMLNEDIFYDDYRDYDTMLRYYDEDVCVDYEHFDPDAYLHYVIMRQDCDDYSSPLINIATTSENYTNIRNELLVGADVIEYLQILAEKFGVDKIKGDKELIDRMYNVFDAITLKNIGI